MVRVERVGWSARILIEPYRTHDRVRIRRSSASERSGWCTSTRRRVSPRSGRPSNPLRARWVHGRDAADVGAPRRARSGHGVRVQFRSKPQRQRVLVGGGGWCGNQGHVSVTSSSHRATRRSTSWRVSSFPTRRSRSRQERPTANTSGGGIQRVPLGPGSLLSRPPVSTPPQSCPWHSARYSPFLALRIYLSEGEAETWGEREIQNRGGLSNRRWRWSLLSERRLHRV